jgi:crotonobetainyl-CoA:carnitine CoA-transferase CaiB-like acyl-CoA transferase
VLSINEMLAHPQTKARDMIVETEHSRLGRVATLGFPIKFGTSPATVRRGAPTLGEHSREVLLELGYAAADIDALAAAGTVIQ